LAAIFRCRPEKFAKYLRWYDLKMEGLSFRLIALIEFHSKKEDREQKFEKYISSEKKPRNIGHVKEESTVKEGVGLIYQAILRKSMPTKEDLFSTLKPYNCPNHGYDPIHGWDCDEGCDYLKRFWIEADHKLKA